MMLCNQRLERARVFGKSILSFPIAVINRQREIEQAYVGYLRAGIERPQNRCIQQLLIQRVTTRAATEREDFDLHH